MAKVKKGGTKFLMSLFLVFCGVALMGENVYAEDDGTLNGMFDIYVYSSVYECVDGYINENGGYQCARYDWAIETETVVVREAAGGGYYINGGKDVELYDGSVKLWIEGDNLKVVVNNCWGGPVGCGAIWSTKSFDIPMGQDIYEFDNNAVTMIGDGKEYEGIGDSKISFGVKKIAKDGIVPENNGETGGVNDPCWNAGLDSEGWIICPTINNLKYTAGPLEGMVEDWLTIETDLYDSDSPTFTVWTNMRNFANVLMIIFLLVVIFSQLTGYGIDNYGIKKMLPRLIIMAVLINLSFLICEIAIDLSNILGVGLRNLFGSIGESMTGGAVGNVVEGLVTAMFAAAGVAGAAAPAGLEIVMLAGGGGEAGVMITIIVVLALIVVLAALLLFFVMLGARMVMIILCVATAPVAFASYVLPNTQNVFKKWWDIFKASLIIFPLCGALGGIAVLIKAMVWTTDGLHLWMMVVGLVAPFLPFFLLPVLLKNAISTLGRVGGALSSMGQRFTSSVKNVGSTVRQSDRFKESMQYAQNAAAAGRARRVMDRLDSRVRGGNATAREMHRYSRAAHTVAAFESGREGMYGEVFGRNDRVNNVDEFVRALNGIDAERASAAFNTLVAQGGINEALTALSGADWSTMDAGVQNRLFQTMSASGIDAAKSYAKYRQTGGKAGFHAWADGSYAASAAGAAEAAAGVKDLSYASHLKEMGPHALDGYDKDQMSFINKHAGNLVTQLGSDNFGAMLSSAAVNSKDAKAQTIAESTITSSIASGAMTMDDLGLTADMLGSMRGETAEAIKDGYVELYKCRSPIPISDSVAEQYALRTVRSGDLATAANNDERIRNRMNQKTKAVFGVT